MDFSAERKGGRRHSIGDRSASAGAGRQAAADNELLHLTDSWVPAAAAGAGRGCMGPTAGRQWPCSLLLLLLWTPLLLMLMSA